MIFVLKPYNSSEISYNLYICLGAFIIGISSNGFTRIKNGSFSVKIFQNLKNRKKTSRKIEVIAVSLAKYFAVTITTLLNNSNNTLITTRTFYFIDEQERSAMDFRFNNEGKTNIYIL